MNLYREQLIKAVRILEAAKIDRSREQRNTSSVKACDEVQSQFEQMLRNELGKRK